MCEQDGLSKSPWGDLPGSRKAGVRASSPDPPKRDSAQAWGEPPWSRTLAAGAAATTARGGRAPQALGPRVGGEAPPPAEGAGKRLRAAARRPTGPVQTSRQARRNAGSEAFCLRVSAGGRKLQRSAQRAAGERRQVLGADDGRPARKVHRPPLGGERQRAREGYGRLQDAQGRGATRRVVMPLDCGSQGLWIAHWASAQAASSIAHPAR